MPFFETAPPPPSPPALRERHIILQEKGKEIRYPPALSLKLCKPNLDGNLKPLWVPPPGQVKRPFPAMIHNARRGNLTGFLADGKILRASDLEVESAEYLEVYPKERMVDPVTGALRMNVYRQELNGGSGELEDVVAQAVEYQTDHLEEEEELPVLKDRLGANLFFIALPVVVQTKTGESIISAEKCLPTYHFWRRGPDPDPYELANHNVGKFLDSHAKFDRLKEEKAKQRKAGSKKATPEGEFEAGSAEGEEESSGLSDPPDSPDKAPSSASSGLPTPPDSPEKPPSSNTSSGLSSPPDSPEKPLWMPSDKILPRRSNSPPRERPAGKSVRELSAPFQPDAGTVNRGTILRLTGFSTLEEAFERQLRREGIQKILDELADYHPEEIAALRVNLKLNTSRRSSLKKKQSLEYDKSHEIIRQPLTTVAHKLALIAWGRPASPIRENDPLTRDDDFEDPESDLDWDADFFAFGDDVTANSERSSPVYARSSSKGKVPAESNEQPSMNIAAEYDDAIYEGFFKPFAGLSSKRSPKETSNVPCSIAHPVTNNPANTDDIIRAQEEEVSVSDPEHPFMLAFKEDLDRLLGRRDSIPTSELDTLHSQNQVSTMSEIRTELLQRRDTCRVCHNIYSWGFKEALEHYDTHAQEMEPQCPHCGRDWRGATFEERQRHIYSVSGPHLCQGQVCQELESSVAEIWEIAKKKFKKFPNRKVPDSLLAFQAKIRSRLQTPSSPATEPAKSQASAATRSGGNLGKRKRTQRPDEWTPEDVSDSEAPSPAVKLAKPRKGRKANHPDATYKEQGSDASAEPSPPLRAPPKRKAQDHPEATFRPAKKGKTAKDADEDSEPETPVKKTGKKSKATRAQATKIKSVETGEAMKKTGEGAPRSPVVVITSPTESSGSSAASGSKGKNGTRSGLAYLEPEQPGLLKVPKVTKKAPARRGKAILVVAAKATKATKAARGKKE